MGRILRFRSILTLEFIAEFFDSHLELLSERAAHPGDFGLNLSAQLLDFIEQLGDRLRQILDPQRSFAGLRRWVFLRPGRRGKRHDYCGCDHEQFHQQVPVL